MPYNNLCKMEIFTTSRNLVIFGILEFYQQFFAWNSFNVVLESFLVYFNHLEVKSQNRPFFTILAYYSLCKMAIFATFQNLVIVRILEVLRAIFCVEQFKCGCTVIFCVFLALSSAGLK